MLAIGSSLFLNMIAGKTVVVVWLLFPSARKQNSVTDAGICLLLPELAPGCRGCRGQTCSSPGSALGWVWAVTEQLHWGLLGLGSNRL